MTPQRYYPVILTSVLSLTAGLALRPSLSQALSPGAQDPLGAARPVALPTAPLPVPAPSLLNPNVFVDLARRAIPSVVNISTSGPAPGGGLRPEDMFQEFFGRRFGNPGFRAPEPRRTSSLGSGFVVDAEGIILTNAHVIDGADEILVSFTEDPHEKPVPGKVIGRDGELDIALIRVKTDRALTALPLGDSESLQVGEYVAAIGNPFGQGHSFTHGVISAKGRLAPGFPLASYLQTDAPINPGNSGGPLLNLRGEVIGINNAIDARAQGIGFAIPVNTVKSVLGQLRDGGRIERGYLGAVIGDLSPELRRQIELKMDLDAPIILEMQPGGPAYRAGLRPYDIVLTFDGRPVRTAQELTQRVVGRPAGDEVRVKVRRDHRELELKVKLGQRPDPNPRSG